MNLWHLAWMHVDVCLLFLLTAALPFVWEYALDYGTGERAKWKRESWIRWRNHYAKDGLPCTPDKYAHGEMVDVPGRGPVCRRCGWLNKNTRSK